MSLYEKYTREEFDALQEKAAKAIKDRCDKLLSFSFQKKESLDMYDLLKPLEKPGRKFEYPSIDKEVMIEAINHKVYEKQIHGKNPEVAIVSLEGYDAIQKLSEFGIKSISIRGCELKLYPSPILSTEQIEIY